MSFLIQPFTNYHNIYIQNHRERYLKKTTNKKIDIQRQRDVLVQNRFFSITKKNKRNWKNYTKILKRIDQIKIDSQQRFMPLNKKKCEYNEKLCKKIWFLCLGKKSEIINMKLWNFFIFFLLFKFLKKFVRHFFFYFLNTKIASSKQIEKQTKKTFFFFVKILKFYFFFF